MSDPTRGAPVAGPPPPPSDPGAGGPGDDQPDRRLLYAIASLLGVIVVLVAVLLVVRAGNDSDTVATDSTISTTTSAPPGSTSTTDPSSSSTTTSTTEAPPVTTPSASAPTTSTTAPNTTTTTEPPVTIAPERCQGRTGPSDPDTVAITFFDAWTVDDRECAEQFATEEAIEDLFVIDGSDAQWEFQECAIDEQEPDRDTVCSFRYEGGTGLFMLHRVPVDGWELYDVDLRADE